MKLTTLLLIVTIIQVSAAGYAQKLTLKQKGANISLVFDEIKKQTGYDVFYLPKILNTSKKINANFKDASLDEVMKACLQDQPVKYTIDEKTIVITKTGDIQELINSSMSLSAIDIKGKIVDEKGLPLPGANVSVKGKKIGTSADTQGEFTLKNVSEGDILVISFLGYQTKELTANANMGTIVLKEVNNELEEIVVQAYGVTKKKSLTNAVSTISVKEIENRQISNVTTALVGAAPGIQTTTGSGQPGEGPAIRIRGFGSINGGVDPLYVVDGAPFDGTLNHINPDDIETISILKDASATALYGSRASNGIVLITTKKGKKGEPVLTAKVTQGLNSRGLQDYETVSAYQYYPLLWESMRNTYLAAGNTGSVAANKATNEIVAALGYNPFNVPDNQVVLENGTINPNAKLLNPDALDWKKNIRKTGLRSEYNLNYKGGSDKSDFFASAGYLKDEGYSVLTDFSRFNGRVNINSQIKEWLKTGANLYGTFQKTRIGNEDSGTWENPFYVDMIFAPIYPVYKLNADGSYKLDATGEKIFDDGLTRAIAPGKNVLAETTFNDNFTERTLFSGKTYLEARFLKSFKFTTNFSIDLNNYRYNIFDNPIIGDGVANGGLSVRSISTTRTINVNQLLNYNKSIDKHNIDVLVGHETYQKRYDYSYGRATGQIVSGSTELKNFNTITNLYSYQDNYNLESYFGRAEYSFDNKYFFSTSFRRDGSSRFSPSSRWGNFWSVGAGWTISNEKFFDVKAINNLKLRASYGLVGSDDLGSYYLYQTFYDTGFKNGNEPGLKQSLTLGNENLIWETNKNMDIALEFGLFKNRINGAVEVFKRHTDNLLFSVPLAVSSGLNYQYQNFGRLENSGIEIQLDGVAIQSPNFKWNVGVNLTSFKNVIAKLPFDEYIDGTKKYMVGKSRYDYWLRQWYGVDPATGSELYVASSPTVAGAKTMPDGTIVTPNGTDAKFDYSGQSIPDFYGSLNNTLTYKNFSLDFRFIYQIGGVAMDKDYQSLMYSGTYGRNLHVDALNPWRNPGDVTDIPKRITGTTMYDSNKWLVDASYLYLRSASLSYDLPKSFIQKLNIGPTKVYLTGENMFMLSKRKGFDPSQAFNGNSSYTYAPVRIISLGLNLTL
ncbi:TonB-dependent receptor [Pedobacter montanisoli]|uniref:TonB-dependent receptor n=1 Tax=Pedobacter montanisoli TaxID=2923277 RepID=A0ABS9ZUQ7_9SPHI|nr:TonB-dependent receptor [Pedobacter montanisoli]MCJ0742321.1 TonB-dependent receptor [Pedobacter montanisoli]